jgi:hypothetical protein
VSVGASTARPVTGAIVLLSILSSLSSALLGKQS